MKQDKLRTICIKKNMTLIHVMRCLSETAEKILLVVDKHQKLLGTVTDGDVRRGIIKGLSLNQKVGKVMEKKFVSVGAGISDVLREAKRLMMQNKLTHIPVLDGEGRILDMISWGDFMEDGGDISPRTLHENKIVIMAGGKGTRLDPFTRILPKPLIPVGDKPVIELIMERLYRCGFYHFIYTLNYKKEYMLLYLKENKFPYNIEWVIEKDYLGTAGGLSLVKDKVLEPFFVMNCDTLLDVDFEEVLNWHKQQRAAMTIVGCYNEFKIPFGVLEISRGKLKKVLEKPVHNIMINTGAYIMEPHLLSYIPEGQSLDMDKFIEAIVKKEKITVYPVASGWVDIGQWEEYKRNSLKIEGEMNV